MLCWHKINKKRALICLITDLVVLSAFLYASQPNNRLTVLQSLVKNGVGVTFNLRLLPLWSFVVFLHLFPLHVLQSLEAEREIMVICILLDKHANLLSFTLNQCFLTCVRISLAKTLFPCFIVMLMNLLKSKDKNDHPT